MVRYGRRLVDSRVAVSTGDFFMKGNNQWNFYFIRAEKTFALIESTYASCDARKFRKRGNPDLIWSRYSGIQTKRGSRLFYQLSNQAWGMTKPNAMQRVVGYPIKIWNLNFANATLLISSYWWKNTAINFILCIKKK